MSQLNVDTIGGQTGTTISVASGHTLTGITQGITEYDAWTVTSNVTSDGDITSNLSRITTPSGVGYFGTGMTQSSGIFTFPSTGFWKVAFSSVFNIGGSGADATVQLIAYVTTNNSSYNDFARIREGNRSSSATNGSAYNEGVIDVTDTSQVKVKFRADSMSSGSYLFANYTKFIFERIGDT